MNKQPMYIKGDIALIAKYNRFDQSVEIGDLNNASDGWVTYDPTQGASSDELTDCLLYTSPSPRDYAASRMPSSA